MNTVRAKAVEDLQQAFSVLWPDVDHYGHPVPRLLSPVKQFSKSRVKIAHGWNPIRLEFEFYYFVDPDFGDRIVSRAVIEIATRASLLALKVQGCDIRYSSLDVIENPRPITDAERLRVKTDYCVGVCVEDTTGSLAITVSLYYNDNDMP